MPVRLVAVLGTGVVDPATPLVRADDGGLTRGDGCFEGLRVVTDAAGVAKVAELDAHLERMTRSARELQIPFDREAWLAFVSDAAAQWREPGETAMKLILTRGGADGVATGLLTISDLPPNYPALRRDGLRVCTVSRGVTSDAFTDAPWLLGGVKTLSYAVNMAAQRHAEAAGCDDVIFVSTDGIVLEASTSAVVWSVGRQLFTTPTDGTGILASTTQRQLFAQASAAGWRCADQAVKVEDLHAADVVWLVGSVRGPIDVIELDGVARERRPDVDAEIRALAGFPAA